LLLPSTVTILAFNPIGARVAARIGARAPVVGGIAALGLGTLVCGFVGRDYHYWLLAAGLLVAGAGLGLLSTPLSDTAVAGPPEELAGTASGVFKMTSMIGGAFGVAVFVAVSGAFQVSDATDRAAQAGLSTSDTTILDTAISDSDLASSVLAQLPDDEAAKVEAEYRLVQADGAGVAIKVAGGVGLVAVPVLMAVWPRRQRAGAAVLEGVRRRG